jgi:hypothetical protein
MNLLFSLLLLQFGTRFFITCIALYEFGKIRRARTFCLLTQCIELHPIIQDYQFSTSLSEKKILHRTEMKTLIDFALIFVGQEKK